AAQQRIADTFRRAAAFNLADAGLFHAQPISQGALRKLGRLAHLADEARGLLGALRRLQGGAGPRIDSVADDRLQNCRASCAIVFDFTVGQIYLSLLRRSALSTSAPSSDRRLTLPTIITRA